MGTGLEEMDGGEIMFSKFETSTWQERDIIARNLKVLYNRWYNEENETFQTMRTANESEYTTAQKNYIAAVSKLGAIQAVFHEMGISFDGLYEIQ